MKTLLSQKQIAGIDIKNSPQVREKINDDAVADYAHHYINKHKMPPPVLFEDREGHYMVGDGLHRISAIMQLSSTPRSMWAFEVRKGSFQDCLRFALKANLENGLRRTNADKRVSVESALKEFPTLSNVKISELAAVSDNMVHEVREELESFGKIEKTGNRIGRDGKIRPLNAKPKKKIEGEVRSRDEVPETVDPPAETYDQTGIIVPEDCLVLWNRRNEIKEMMAEISDIKSRIKNGKDSGDPLFFEIGNELFADLSVCREGISYALPHVVCPTCNGHLKEKCQLCHGRGVISKHLYETVPAKMREMRENNSNRGTKMI